MKLYISHTSPYARIPRIVLREKRLADCVDEIVARTREQNSPYYDINPSGRIPFLIDGEVSLEGSDLAAAYLDHVGGAPLFESPSGADRWQALQFQEMARSLLDGLAVWVRELKRPPHDQSAVTLTHERDRTKRLLSWWEDRAGHAQLLGPLNMAQITLATALDLDQRVGPFSWRQDHPGLLRWMEALTARPSFQDTALPDGSVIG